MMKKKMSKFTRILIASIVSVIALGTACWGVTKLVASGTYEPIVWRFNNEADFSKLNAYKTTVGFHDGEDGKKAISLSPSTTHDSYIFIPSTEMTNIDFSNYKYIVFSVNSVNQSGKEISIYADTVSGKDNFRFTVPSDAGWTTTIVDVVAEKAYSYDSNGKLLQEAGFGYKPKVDYWTGTLTTLRIDYARNCAKGTTYLEYMGLFHTKAEAEAYAGAMPNDVAEAAISATLSKGYTLPFSQAYPEELAMEYAAKKVTETVEAYCAENGEITYDVQIKEITDYQIDGTGGSFKARVWVYLGDALKRNLIDETITFKVNAKPNPVAVHYNSPEVVNGMSWYKGDDDTLTREFVADSSVQEGGYVRLTASSTYWCDPNYNNYLDQAGVRNTFTFDDYPYMKILYNREVYDTGERTSVYITDTNNKTSSFDFDLYKLSTGQESHWQALVADMRSDVVNFYDTSGQFTGSGTISLGTNAEWTGTPHATSGNPLRFDLTRQNTAERTMSVAYIAFFATKEEAIAYPNSAQGQFDTNTLSNHATFEVGNYVTTDELAAAEAKAHVESFNFTTDYAISNGSLTKPTTETEGKYTFDVVFDNNDNYKVSCTMTIAKTEEPIVYTLDNSSMVSKFEGTGNVKKALENGYLKMTTLNSAQEDGFYLQAKDAVLGEEFDLAGRRFAKVRYQISGVSGVENNTEMQFYVIYPDDEDKDTDPEYYSKESYVLSANEGECGNGDFIELIVDFSASGTDDAVWVRNVSENGQYQVKSLKNSTIDIPLGTVMGLRFNPARRVTTDRTSYVEYIGFFSSLEEAKAYDGIAESRLDEAETNLRATTLELEWGDGNTEEKALTKLNEMIQSDIGCTLKDIVYTAPTEEAEGSVTFTAQIVSGGVQRDVTGLKLTIGKCPNAVIWRFNEESALENLTMMENTDAVIENHVLKLVDTYPSTASGFGFKLATNEDTQFYLQNNPYIVVKYRRDGLGPVNINYTTNLYSNTSFYPANGNLGFGPESGTWYTSVIDTSVTDYETPLVRNYSHDENVDDFNFYIPYKVKQNSWVLGDAYKFKGLSQSFSFNMANFKDVERTCYIEYVGFFPTLDAALNYAEEYESVKSDTEVALKGYTGETVSYYDGNTEAAAQATAERLIDELLLEDAYPIKKLNDVEIAITTKSHTAPVKDTSDGTYTFQATITYKDQKIYTLDSCTLTISQSAGDQVYLFTNPDFVATIDGAVASDNYDYMQLGEGVTQFALDVSNRNISLANYPRISLGVTEATGPVTMTVNGETLTLYSDTEAIADTELSVAFTENGYTVYKDAEQSATGTLSTDSMDIVFDSISFGFGAEGAKIRYLVFDIDASVDEVFDDTAPEVLTNIADITDTSCHAGDASTSAKAVTRARKLVSAQLGSGVSVAKATLDEYRAATTTETGTYTCTVLVSSGETQATFYEFVEVSGEIALQPAKPIFINNEKFVNNNRYAQNLNISLVDGCIHTETISASVEDAWFLFYPGDLTDSQLYLPDYPYISVKFKRTGAEKGETGDTQIYFWSDENKGNPNLNCSFGGADVLDEWITAIIDTNEKTITLYDMDDEKINTTRTIDGSLGQYIGYMEYMRLTMARNIKADRTADIEYVGFFSTMEAAKNYMDGLFIDDYTKFTGNECAVLDKVIESEALTVELAARVDASSTDVVRPLISNKGDATEPYFALEVTTDGKVQLTCGSKVVATTTESIADGKWTYITASVDKDGAKIYLNGEKAAEGTANINFDAISADTLIVGGDHMTNAKPYIGDIANLKLYNAVTEPSNYEMPETLTDGMVAGWSMGDITSERNFLGYEANAYTLTFNNELSREGHEFIGSDCLISENVITAAPQTFAGWMNIARKQLSGTYSLISTSGMRVQLIDGQIVAFYNDAQLLSTNELELVPGMWTHVAATFDATNSTVTIYVNGKSVATGKATIDTSSVTLGKVYIGATDADTDLFVGMLSDIRLWSNVRSDIAAGMAGTLDTTDSCLLGAWDVWTHDNLNYTDASSNGNIAKLTSDSWYKLEGRETPAYSIVHIGDTQNSTGYNGEPKFQAMFDWIAENVDTMNMVYLTHAGDVTQINTEAQWAEAKEGFDKIEGLLPYAISLGNHDYAAPSHGIAGESRDDRHFNKYFEYDEYAKNIWFGEAFEEGSRTNLYNLINVDWDEDGTVDEEYIFMALEYGPRDEVVDWACEALEKYSDRKAIITTHCYFETNGSYEIKDVHMSGYEWKDANEGFDLWNKILYEYPNVVMLTCGHSQGEAACQQVNKNKEGNNVIQIMADPSAYNGFPSVDSLIFMMEFDAEGNMHTYYYSADRDLYYGTCNEFDYSAEDHFKIPTSESK